MTCTYVKTTIIKEDNGWYSLLVQSGMDEKRIYRELTRELNKISKLSQNINAGQVSALHIDDMIEDFLP